MLQLHTPRTPAQATVEGTVGRTVGGGGGAPLCPRRGVQVQGPRRRRALEKALARALARRLPSTRPASGAAPRSNTSAPIHVQPRLAAGRRRPAREAALPPPLVLVLSGHAASLSQVAHLAKQRGAPRLELVLEALAERRDLRMKPMSAHEAHVSAKPAHPFAPRPARRGHTPLAARSRTHERDAACPISTG